MDNWSSLPFNGQSRRMRVISDISQRLDVGAVIETGTFLGSSTPYLAGFFGCKTYTIEIDQFNAERAQKRFDQNHKNLDIEMRLGDSAIKIVELLGLIDPRKVVFAYLDAHWLDAIPTQAEIQALLDWGGQWIAVVDDFKVMEFIKPIYRREKPNPKLHVVCCDYRVFKINHIQYDNGQDVLSRQFLNLFVPCMKSENKTTGMRRS